MTKVHLTEYSRSDTKLAFYGGIHNRAQRRDILIKPKYPRTAEGIRPRGFGHPTLGRKIRMVRRPGGELRTDSRNPSSIEKYKGKSAHRISDSMELNRLPLLLNSLES